MQPATGQRFYRGSDRMLGGVCSGLAEGFHVDPLWVRLAFVLLAFLQGIGVVVYLALWLVMPERQVTGGSSLDSMSADLRRAWADVRGLFARPRPAPPPPPASPEAPATQAVPETPPAATTVVTASASVLLGLILVGFGLVFLANNIGLVNWSVLWPAGLIALGILLLVRALARKP
ncbi:PspC domain-containing protein [bacterium]|nr:MAG: PspC domain-containing protein [bacterium]